MAMAIEISMS